MRSLVNGERRQVGVLIGPGLANLRFDLMPGDSSGAANEILVFDG